MTPNLAMRDFVRGFDPCDTDELWQWLVVARLVDPRKDLPPTREALDVDLGVLRALGYLTFEADECWRMKYPQPVERVLGAQQELFA